jgi:hypothetical protein
LALLPAARHATTEPSHRLNCTNCGIFTINANYPGMRPPYNLCALTGALQPTAALPIQDLQPLPIDIDRQMIDPTADIAQEELRFEHEGTRVGG